MAPESENNPRLEIGHVLFLTYRLSKLLIQEQKERSRQLNEIVLAMAQDVKAAIDGLVRLTAGMEWRWSFGNSSEEPAQCALALFFPPVAQFQ